MAFASRNQNNLFDPAKDRRAEARATLKVQGRIFSQKGQVEAACLVLDLSPDGAGLKSTCTAALGSPVILYVDGLGRFEGVIVRHDRLYIGVQFKGSATVRARIAERIAAYLEKGTGHPTPKRTSPRLSVSEAAYSFTTDSGQTHACEIDDIALSGASFKTATRPPIGARVSFGKTTAIVVRHTESGFAVTFSGPQAA
jgi:hypothetical protein